MVSVDGYFAGVDGNIDWHNTDAEFGKFADEQTGEFGALIFGRVTYDLMAGYWPKQESVKDDPIVANIMNSLPKIVFSKSLGKVEWNNSKLYHDIDAEEVKKWKQEPGKDMAIFGSGTIVQAFAKLGLIDEYRLMINPIILGKGKLLFKDVDTLKLKLINTRTFGNGNILLAYEPVK